MISVYMIVEVAGKWVPLRHSNCVIAIAAISPFLFQLGDRHCDRVAKSRLAFNLSQNN
jgi:hypothetical protein